MFYENYRILRKQNFFISKKARSLIESFKSKNMSNEEIMAALEIVLESSSSSEWDTDIVKRAIVMLLNKDSYGY